MKYADFDRLVNPRVGDFSRIGSAPPSREPMM
jgi:hypothetical protein